MPFRRWSPLLALPLVLAALWLTQRDLIDLTVYRYGAERVLDGLDLYAPREGLPFTYPPFAALLMTPLALASWELAVALLTALSVAGLAVLVRRPSLLLLAGACALEPVWQTLAFGQVNLILAGLILFDLAADRDRPWRGALLGVAAGIKLTPVFFFGYLVVTRQWLALRNAVLATAGTVAVGFAVLPSMSWDYWTRVVSDAERIGGLAYSGNQSVMGVLFRLTGSEAAARPLWLVLATGLGLLSLYVARRLHHEGDVLAAVCVTALGMLLASPVSWSHHWVWAVPLTVVLWRRSRRWAVAWATLFVLAPHWWPPHTNDQELQWHTWQVVAGNAYVIAAVLLLVGVRKLARPASPPEHRGPERDHERGADQQLAPVPGPPGVTRPEDRLVR
ncbi:MAG TPA: glycosyltransferase 87 family protein [Nocardioidaceae bacterium]|nr:glycosyltransferase 87 family protein [Nocardioidaceae bacterium]